MSQRENRCLIPSAKNRTTEITRPSAIPANTSWSKRIMSTAYHKFRSTWALLALVFVLAAPSCVRAQNVAVSGNVKSITGVGSGAGVNVRFRLRGYTGSVPKVSGTSVVLPATVGCGVCIDIAPDASGNISGLNIYGNDQIIPGGTWYTVEFSYQGRIIFACDYLITGVAFNFTNATCLNAIQQLASTTIITQAFLFIQSPAATVWTINHNLNDTSVVFDFYDPTNTYIIPDSVQNTSPNQTVAHFVNATAGSAVIIHAGQIAIATNQPNALLSNPAGNQTTLFDLSTTGSFTSPRFRSNSVNPANTGIFALASGDALCWRNAANNADLCLNKNGSDLLFFSTFQFAFLNVSNTWTLGQTFTVPAAFTQATGTAPFTVSSSTVVANLNASALLGSTWAIPGTIGSTTPNTGAFTTLTASSNVTSPIHATNSASPALSGIFRCASADNCLTFRNNANNADLVLGKNASDQPTFGGNILPTFSGVVNVGHLAVIANSGQLADGGVPNNLVIKAAINSSVCTTGTSAYSTCTTALSWTGSFVDTAYGVSCSGAGAITGNPYVAGVTAKTVSGVTVTISNGSTSGAVASSYGELDCIGIHP